MYDYLIVGAGISGCTFAEIMSRHGYKCLVVDKRDHIGGNCYTRNLNGIDIHVYGAHILRTSNRKTWQYFSTLAKITPFKNAPMAFCGNKMYNLPFNMNLFKDIYGVYTPNEAMALISKDCIPNSNPRTVEEKALATVGKKIYEMFIKEYTEKQWGDSCSKLPAYTIGDLQLRYTYDNDYYNASYSGIPESGYTKLFETMLKDCDVILGEEYTRNSILNKIAKKVVYTGQLDKLYDYKLGALEYRSLRFDLKRFEKANFQGCAVVNHTSERPAFTRTIEHKHFKPCKASLHDFTYVSYEYPVAYSRDDEKQIPFYVLNDEKNRSLHAKYKSLAEGDCYLLLGRLALYEYDSMDVCIEIAHALAEKELQTNV